MSQLFKVLKFLYQIFHKYACRWHGSKWLLLTKIKLNSARLRYATYKTIRQGKPFFDHIPREPEKKLPDLKIPDIKST